MSLPTHCLSTQSIEGAPSNYTSPQIFPSFQRSLETHRNFISFYRFATGFGTAYIKNKTEEESGQSRENIWVERKEEKGTPVLNNHLNLFTR